MSCSWLFVLLLFICAEYLVVHCAARERGKKGCPELKKCLEPFPMLVDLLEKDKSGALATLTYGVLLDSVCSKQAALKLCLTTSPCHSFKQTYVGLAVNDTLEYICGEGRDALLSEAGCYSRDDFEWGTYQCSRTMRLETDIATLQDQAGKADKTRFCRVFDNLLKCIHVNVERTCSSKAANFTRSVFGKTIKAFAKKIGCPFFKL
ncbi:unnamed protein product [Lymnaea stagnalis]|uniref:DUF19 domain-containing protein n=1 Tax=Lymnaea stagnalis TaxID=6523 RepID=A0AAV2HQY7_LYMST